MKLERLLFYAVIAFAASNSARGDVIVVDSAGGGDHTTLQAAVDAAVDGDILLVRQGAYAGFRVDDKSLSVVAEEIATVDVLGGIAVENLAAARSVTLVGLQVTGALGSCPTQGSALLARNDAGAVRALSCRFIGAGGSMQGCYFLYCPCDPKYGYGYTSVYYGHYLDYHLAGWDAVRLFHAEQVTLARCVVRGGFAIAEDDSAYGVGGDGGHGMLALESNLALYDCIVEGQNGAYAAQIGGDGGTGLFLEGSRAFGSGTEFRGDRGADAYDFFYSAGGDGGHGASVPPGSELDTVACSFFGGDGGMALFVQGEPGQPIAGGGTVTRSAGPARSVWIDPPTDDGSQMSIEFRGDTADFVFLALSLQPGFEPAPGLSGVIVIGPGVFVPMGFVPPSGVLVKNAGLNILDPGVEGIEVYAQGVFLDAALSVRLASWTHIVVLDPNL